MDNDEKSSTDHQSSSIQYKTIRSRAITGILHAQNKGAVDWGWQSLVAYGCQTAVVVVDPKTVQVLQTLNKHRSYVVKVKWAKENYHHDVSNPYYPKLASADINGNIIIWDVIYSKVSTLFSDGNNKPILDMEWLSFWSSFNDFLAVLHPPYSFIIWNTTNGNRLWKKSYTETLLSFSFDPFDPSNVAFLAQDGILFIDDFTLSKVPSSNGRKFYISNPSLSSTSSTNLMSLGNTTASDEKSWTRERLRQRMRALVNAEPRPSGKSESSSQNECLGLTYHQSVRHQLLLLYVKEILVIDLELNQTVGLVSVERNGSPFTQVFCCRQRDVLYCLHENGSVSFRMRRKINNSSSLISPLDAPSSSSSPYLGHQGDSDVYLDVGYDTRCISDSMRLTKHAQLLGMACCPITETKAVLVVSDGRLVFLELNCIDKDSSRAYANYVNGDLNVIPNYYSNNSNSDSRKNFIPAPSSSLCDLIMPTYSPGVDTSAKVHTTFKFLATGMLSGVAAPPLTIRMCPPLTTKNWNAYQPYLAAGTSQGTVQIFCMASGMLQKELSVHTSPIRGIEWINLHGFISYAYPNLSNSGQVRNELVITNALTGQLKLLRAEKGEESPIEMIRVSCLKQYFVVAFKEEPFELWDLHKVCLLRTMPKKFPIITALEWSPVSTTKKKMSSLEKESGKSTATTEQATSSSENNASGDATSVTTPPQEKIPVKEQFVFTDADGQLYNFSVEGSVIKDGTKIPANGGMRNITTIAWRSEQIVMGDIDGNLTLWDLKARVSKTVSTHRGWIKKIRFAPGRGNMKILVLYNDGIDIWDLSRVEVISSIKCPKDMPKTMDVDWAASDTPVLATVDGCLYLMDLKLKHSMSPTYRYHLEEPVFIPHLSTSEAALNLRAFLQHQGWRSTYSLTFSEADGIRGDDLTALQQYITAIDSDIREFLPRCQFGTAQRCLLTARLFGDESELHFWMVALYYLRAQRVQELNKQESSSEENQDSEMNAFSPEKLKIQGMSAEEMTPEQPLDCSYDVVCDSVTYQARQLDRINLHDSKRVTYEQTKRCAESLIMLGQTDRAVQLLLETDSDSDGYQLDCLKACLVASVCSSGTAQSTIKLVATNLIANGHISEGVQLLCLIGKAVDACRYLQSYGKWNQATWLAKATLNSTECQEVMRRWVDHLFSPVINQKHKAVLVLLSMAQFYKVLEMLLGMKCIERAAMFVNACNEFGFLEKNESSSALIEAVFLEYARYLFSLGNTPAAFHYCDMVGSIGEQLRKEMEILAEDVATTATGSSDT